MRFNLWFKNECDERNVDFVELLLWLIDLHLENDFVADIMVKEAE